MKPSIDDLCDLLSDLGHDLGKYLLRPVAWLPADADAAALRAAVAQALDATQRGPLGPRSAAQIWAAFLSEVGDHLAGFAGWSALNAAVEAALAWGGRLDAPIDRAAVHGDFKAVGHTIRALLDEVEDA